MEKPNKLLFVHDKLPAEGVSGMIVFLRHFKKLKNWEIHILVPENSFNEAVVNQYPKNFIVHTFKFRQWWWPPFRENNHLSVKIRLLLMEQSFKNIITAVKPNIIISVLYHYYSVAFAKLCARINLPFLLFLHDRWDNKAIGKKAQQHRIKYGAEAVNKSNYLLPVTASLLQLYLGKSTSDYEIFPPIPEGYVAGNTHHKKNTLVYAGSVNQYHIQLFDRISVALTSKNYTLLVITNELDKLTPLTRIHKNITVKQAFPSNAEALSFIAEHATAILVNYGWSEQDNPDAFYSFPSKFIEFIHLGIPIIASAPKGSPFELFLTQYNWPLMLKEPPLQSMIEQLNRMDDPQILDHFTNIQHQLANGVFNPNQIQDRFENILNHGLNTENRS